MIQVIRNAALPAFRFEWHPQTRKVYLIRLPAEGEQRRFAESGVMPQLDAEVIAEHADTHAQAFGAVQTWSRGYKAGRAVAEPAGV
jgi:hypothetical protein